MTYPKRLIEVDLPIKRISAHARREKSIRHGHISTLHIWWARRPLAACRAVICAALWPDPADPACPPAFRAAAARALGDFAERVRSDLRLTNLCSAESARRWQRTTPASLRPADPAGWPDLRYALLDFIADFANWDASTVPAYLETARALTRAAHEALGGEPGTRPLVVDPFAGGGAIPLEALRVGADAFASDLNPVAVLLNKVVLEYIPKYGQRLADEVRRWGAWVKAEAEKELAEFYPRDPDGATPIAYLWARTIRCEGPGCGAEVPLIRSLWLSKKDRRSVVLRLVANRARKRVDVEIVTASRAGEGTVRKGSATCPVCGFTTPVKSVRQQLRSRRGGAADARLLCVVTTRPGEQGRFYRLPTEADLAALRRASRELEQRQAAHHGTLALVPDEMISPNELRRISVPIYGMERWGDMFTPRQALALSSIASRIAALRGSTASRLVPDLNEALGPLLALSLSKEADLTNALCSWKPDAECPVHLFARQAVPMLWDFAESVAISESSGSWFSMVERTAQSVESLLLDTDASGNVEQATATRHPLPDDSAMALITDPPYYDAVPYAYLSDFFYVWLRRALAHGEPELFRTDTVPKDEEIVVDRPHELSNSHKDVAFYERELTRAFGEGRRIVRPDGVGTIVFASKTTASWEAILSAVVEAGWIITGSWPIDTERPGRLRAQDSAALASSVHLVCRPREHPDGSPRAGDVGDWRDVLGELPRRIHEWLPRLMSEGVVGADAIFACLGPALEVYSRYSRVEKASGEPVKLGEYLEHVWAAVAREALTQLFRGADASGLEPDARLTAIWLWTLSTSNGADKASGQASLPGDGAEEEEAGDDEGAGKPTAVGRYALEFDAARKIAQGLGAHLDKLGHVVEVKGGAARLLGVAERTLYLFGKDGQDGKDGAQAAPVAGRPRGAVQLGMFEDLAQAEEETALGVTGTPPPGTTVLDRVHQAMILFGAGRAEALRRFLVEDGVGKERALWGLAQSLSALYPGGSEEKRWVDGVLARKKGLGF